MTRSKSNPEHVLQSECVKWYSANHNGQPQNLWANFSETLNPIEGGIKVSLGLKKSVPDLIYCQKGELIGIEMKIEGSRHNTEHVLKQAKFLTDVCKYGYFCTSLEGFKWIIERHRECRGGVVPGVVPGSIVVETIKNVKTKTFSFNTCLFEK